MATQGVPLRAEQREADPLRRMTDACEHACWEKNASFRKTRRGYFKYDITYLTASTLLSALISSTNSWIRMLNSIEDFNFLSFDLLSWHQAKHLEVSCSANEFSTSRETRNTSWKWKKWKSKQAQKVVVTSGSNISSPILVRSLNCDECARQVALP